MKFVSPWHKLEAEYDSNNIIAIYEINKQKPFIKIHYNPSDPHWGTSGLLDGNILDDERVYIFDTLEAAKAQVEKVLLNNGYKFLSQEEFERLRLLV